MFFQSKILLLKPAKLQLFFLFLLFFQTGCGNFKTSDNTIDGIDNRISATYIGPNEPAYCSLPTVYSNFITITGLAQYQFRQVEYTSQFKGLGDVSETLKPIRYAEYVVLNQFGQVIQCGETTDQGTFSFTVPNNGQVFRLQIRSRADNTNYKASVLKSPESNQIYFIESAFAATINQNLTLTASATGNLLGGAFNILDQILNYNILMRSLTAGCTGCTFSVAPKIKVYWEKGFNPGSYFAGNPVASFYIKGSSRLFILGGVNGDVNYTDTDHFDNSIIAHEYFHFLEDTYSISDSPGGTHNGNQIIDPRLAWSEGVAQYFQSVMTGINRVLDSVGNRSGSSTLIVDYSVELTENDIPNQIGEGEFREFSIARLLWDAYDNTAGETQSPVDCSVQTSAIDDVHDKCTNSGFRDFWAVFTRSDFFSNTYQFRSSGLFHQLHAANFQSLGSNNSSNLNPLRSYERQTASRNYYGTRLRPSCGLSTHTMQGPFVFNSSGQFIDNHPVTNRRYLYIEHGGGNLALQLRTQLGSGLSANTDLYLFRQDYVLGSSNPIASSTTSTFDSGSSEYVTNLSVSSLASGYYMIIVNVRNFNSGSNPLTFTLRSGSSLATLGDLCVAPTI